MLYSNDPAINQAQEGSSKRSSRPVSRRSRQSKDEEEKGDQSSSQGENRVMYEESILMTLLGPDYMQYISQETGEWINEEAVLAKFHELFETRIRYIFDAEEID